MRLELAADLTALVEIGRKRFEAIRQNKTPKKGKKIKKINPILLSLLVNCRVVFPF